MPLCNYIEPDENTIRILITTDNHVGFNENDPIRGDDSWKTFEEIASLAKEKDVDMILQSGDLFHVNKPSKKSMYHVLRALRMNCLGDKPCELELLSDPSFAIDDGFNIVNYEDPNINVAIPVFSISGNHDDATGEGLLSPLDILSVAGFVNHFGRVLENDKITISPLLFQKGTTKLALYGLANVRDERLYKTFRDQQVKFMKPKIRTNEWFNLMAVHQNHSAHTNTSYLPENFLPSFLDLVIWGHEHECIPHAVPNVETGFATLQPGSSVVTSLCEGEAVEKNVFIVNIKETDYSLETIRLKTVRPFVMQELSLSKSGIISGPASKSDISRFLSEKIEDLILQAKDNYKLVNQELFDVEDGEQVDEDKLIPLPLIRLRVEYSGDYEVENPRRFSNKFVGKVANINDVVQFFKKKEYHNKLKPAKFKDIKKDRSQEESADIQVHSLVTSFLQTFELSLLPEDGLNEAVKKFVQNEDKSVLKSYVDTEMETEIDALMHFNLDENSDMQQVLNQLKKRTQLRQSTKADAATALNSMAPQISEKFVVSSDDDIEVQQFSASGKVAPLARSKTTTPEDNIVIISDDDHSNNNQRDEKITSDSDIDGISDIFFENIPEPSKKNKSRSKPDSKTKTTTTTRGRGSGRGRGGTTGTRKTTSTTRRGKVKSTASSSSQLQSTQSNLLETISRLARK